MASELIAVISSQEDKIKKLEDENADLRGKLAAALKELGEVEVAVRRAYEKHVGQRA